MDNNLKVCPNCNTVNNSDDLFCRECGNKIEEVRAQEQKTESVSNDVEQTVIESDSNDAKILEQSADSSIEDSFNAQNSEGTAHKDNDEQNSCNQESEFQPQFDEKSISESEFAAYVGKNQDKFMPKFIGFFNGSKTSFSPLVFLLSLFVSPIAAAFWFLHRKIYKFGVLVLSVGIVLTIINFTVGFSMVNDIIDPIIKNRDLYSYYNESAKTGSDENMLPLDRDSDYYDDFNDEFSRYFGDYNDDSDDYYNYDNPFDDEFSKDYMKQLMQVMPKYLLWFCLVGLLDLAIAILLGIFAKYIYFKDAAKKIMQIKRMNPTPSSINDIAAAGGTNCVPWVIILISYVVISFIVSFAFIFSIVQQIAYNML